MVALTSAAGLVGFLSEPDPALQMFALERLNHDIDTVWPEVSGSIGQMYVLPSRIALLRVVKHVAEWPPLYHCFYTKLPSHRDHHWATGC